MDLIEPFIREKDKQKLNDSVLSRKMVLDASEQKNVSPKRSSTISQSNPQNRPPINLNINFKDTDINK